MDPAIGDLPVGDVLIRGDRIVEVGEGLVAPEAEIIDAAGMIVLPGLIDGHRHAWQSVLRGLGSDWTFSTYMVEARAMYCGCFDADDAYLANYLGGLESLQAGITTVVDHCHLQSTPAVSDALARGLKDSGVGGFFCYALQNVPFYVDGQPVNGAAVRDLLTRLPDDWHDANAAQIRDRHFGTGPLRFGIALPEATPYMPAEHSAAILARAEALSPALVTGHWNAVSKADYYQSSLPDLVRAGAFASPTVLSHNNCLSENDLSLMASHGIGLCTCPDIECGMGLGPFMARRFAELGGAACLGLDVTAYMQADMFKQARLLLLMERKKLAEESGGMPVDIGYPAKAALELLTLTGARALGMEAELGSLTVGKRADLVLVAQDPVMQANDANPASSLIFYTNPSEIDTVIVAGEVRKRGGALVGVDMNDLFKRAHHTITSVRRRYADLPRDRLAEVWAGMF
jgi:cytosine/adenosine deaminase-related metal-dependent hydrolase